MNNYLHNYIQKNYKTEYQFFKIAQGEIDVKKNMKYQEDNKNSRNITKFSLFTCTRKEFKEWFDPL